MASKNKEVFLRGKSHYFMLLGRGDVKYSTWCTGLYLDEDSYNTFMDMKKDTDTTVGIMNEVKISEDGYLIQLKRPWSRTYKGETVAFTAPTVLDSKGIPWNSDRNVGNGSDITVKCEYYSFKPPFQKKRGSAIRLVSAMINDLVPYEPNRDLTEDQAAETKGLVAASQKQYF